jgi:hypothetical protein
MAPTRSHPLPPPEDLHEWVSFEDPEEDRTWVFDVTFLLSDWTCIFGCGCQGVLTAPAPELVQGCCSYGAHFTGDDDVADTRRHVARLRDDQWQFAGRARKKDYLVTNDEGVTTTRLVKGACIFLNRPGWPGGAGCALHQAAVEAGERPLDWKPDVCWQLPLRQVDHVDEYGHVTSTVREWKRRDWGPGGDEFAWWCTESHEAFVGRTPYYVSARDDLVEMVGAEVYGMLAAALDGRRRTARRPLAHPALVPDPVRPPARG